MDGARVVIRSLRSAPGYAVASILTLGLTIGATTAIFSAVSTVLFRPNAIRDPERLVICWASDPRRALPLVELSYDNFEHWQHESQSFVSAAAISSSTLPVRLDAPGGSVHLASAAVSASFFDTLGVGPEQGRVLRQDDEVPNAPRVVVVSHRAWVGTFGANADIVGQVIHLPTPYTVVGVMPATLDFPRDTDLWMPAAPALAQSATGWDPRALTDVGALFVVGRLRGGVSTAKATDELDRLAGRLDQSGASHRFGTAIVVTPFVSYVFGPVRDVLWVMGAAVGLLLLIGCANVSGLMLTRVTTRRREQAVRVALGASRWAVAQTWLYETWVLTLVGGFVGLLFASWMLRGIIALAPPDVPHLADVAIDARAAVLAALVTAIAALLCVIGPMRQSGAMNVVDALKDEERATPGTLAHRGRSQLLMVQIALSVVLLAGAGLALRSFMALRRVDLGFDPSGVVSMTLDPHDPKPSSNAWMSDVVERVSHIPGVQAAGAIYLQPLALGPIGQESLVLLDGQPDTSEARRQNPLVNYELADPGYFAAMRIALKRGRSFGAQDTVASPRVALVSESTARRLWPGQEAVGKRMLLPTFGSDRPGEAWRTVVGVVSDVRYRGLDDVRLDVYDALAQTELPAMELVARTNENPASVIALIQREARRLDSNVIIERADAMEAIVARVMAPWRFAAWILAMFGLTAVALSATGIFSITSLHVAERQHEFAIRVALGARFRDILEPVLYRAVGVVAIGTTIGIVASALGARVGRRLLFHVPPFDPLTYAGVLLMVLLIVGAASFFPARRALRIDPMRALKRG